MQCRTARELCRAAKNLIEQAEAQLATRVMARATGLNGNGWGTAQGDLLRCPANSGLLASPCRVPCRGGRRRTRSLSRDAGSRRRRRRRCWRRGGPCRGTGRAGRRGTPPRPRPPRSAPWQAHARTSIYGLLPAIVQA